MPGFGEGDWWVQDIGATLPVLMLGGLTSVPGAIVGGVIIGVSEKLGEFYWGPLLGGGIGRVARLELSGFAVEHVTPAR